MNPTRKWRNFAMNSGLSSGKLGQRGGNGKQMVINEVQLLYRSQILLLTTLRDTHIGVLSMAVTILRKDTVKQPQHCSMTLSAPTITHACNRTFCFDVLVSRTTLDAADPLQTTVSSSGRLSLQVG